MKYRKIIITSGPTREWIDPVRFLSNSSSGYMGFCIAVSCREILDGLCPELVYIAGPTEKEYRKIPGARNWEVETTLQMKEKVLEEIEDHSILIMAAAPADFRPLHPRGEKIKKEESRKIHTISLAEGTGNSQQAENSTGPGIFSLELIENPDILQAVSRHVREKGWNAFRIGFSAETRDLETNALSKLERKDLDWIVGNEVGWEKGFGNVESFLRCYGKKGERLELGPDSKPELTRKLIRHLVLPLFR